MIKSAPDTRAGRPFTVVVPLADLKSASKLVRLASAMGRAVPGERAAKVIALGVVVISDVAGYTEGTVPAQFHRSMLSRLRRLDLPPEVEIRTLVRVSRQVWHGIVQTAEEEEADLVMFGWKGWTRSREAVFGTTIDDVIENAPCDIVIVKNADPRRCGRIMVPVRGGPHAVLANRLACALASEFGGGVTALRIETPGMTLQERLAAEEEFAAVLNTSGDDAPIRTIEEQADSVKETILRHARAHQAVIMGAAGTPEAEYIFGPITQAVAQEFRGMLMIVKTRLPADLGHRVWEALTRSVFGPAQEAVDLPTRVDKWFAENTFDAEEFGDIEELVRLKQRQGLRISLGLPALNESETVGRIICSLKRELVDRAPLLDEMVLIDSGSTDTTREIAAELGVPVVVHQEILPEYGAHRGKGEALWKSLYALDGDIIAWVDTDIRNIHPRFVYGVLGPLLRYPKIQYVKAFYKRPIRLGGTLQATGGGRVTELTARPLLNLFFPELSGIIQPLSGEYAGRRELLEQLPFFTGYGVETGLLIDILGLAGLDAIGQVDLRRRVHRNQELVPLSAMAFTIIQVVMNRLEQRHKLQLLSEVNKSMKLIQHERHRFHVELRRLEDIERPPMASLPEYRARHASERMLAAP